MVKQNSSFDALDAIVNSKKASASSAVTAPSSFGALDAIVQKKEPRPSKGIFGELRETGKHLEKKFAKGFLGNADLLALAALPPNWALDAAGVPVPDMSKVSASAALANTIKDTIGWDINDTHPNNAATRILGHGAEFIGGSIGGAGLGKTIYKYGKYARPLISRLPNVTSIPKAASFIFGNPENAKALAKMTAAAGGMGIASGAFQEGGVDPLVADLTASFGPATPGLAKYGAIQAGRLAKDHLGSIPDFFRNLASKAHRSAYAERKLAESLQHTVGTEAPAVARTLNEHQPIPGIATAEASGNVDMAKFRNQHMPELDEAKLAQSDAMRQSVKDLAPGTEDMYDVQTALQRHGNHMEHQHTQHEKLLAAERDAALEAFSHRAEAEEAGEAVRHAIETKVEGHEHHRASEAKPLYQNVRESDALVHPENAHAVIDKELQHAKGKMRKAYLKVKEILTPNQPRSAKDIEYNKSREAALEKYKDAAPELLDKIHAEYPPLPPQQMGAYELQQSKIALGDMVDEARAAGRRNEARALQEIDKSLDIDLAKVPEIRVADKAYAEASKPINAITEDPTLGKVIKKNPKTQEYKSVNSTVPQEFVSSLSSPEKATKLHREIGHDANAMSSMQGYINNDLMKNVVKDGHVDLKALGAWKKKNPGAFKLYPDLEKQLSNVHTAQNALSEVAAKNKKALDRFNKEVAGRLLGDDPEKVVSKALGGAHASQKIEEAVGILAKQERSGSALRGLQQGFVNHFDTHALQSKTPEAAMQYWNKNKSAFSKVFDKDQMAVLEQSLETLGKQHAATKAGRISPKFEKNMDSVGNMLSYLLDHPKEITTVLPGAAEALSTAGSLIFGATTVGTTIGALGTTERLSHYMTTTVRKELISRAMSDPKFAAYLLQKPTKYNREQLPKVWGAMKGKLIKHAPHINRSIIRDRSTEDRRNDKQH